MTKQTSFAHQKKVLTYFSSRLDEIVNTLNALSDNYEKTIDSIYEEQGLMEEIYSDYKQIYMESTRAKLSEVAEKILNEDIPFIEKEIDFMSAR